MKCPFCNYQDSRVVDSRGVDEAIRRRRVCLKCSQRFTTFERLQPMGLLVVKKDGRRESFDRQKLLAGIRKACEKRPLPASAIEEFVDTVTTAVQGLGKIEVPSATVGEMVMERLRNLDEIAYIRFASVYRPFADLESLRREMDLLARTSKQSPVPKSQLLLIPEKDLDSLDKEGQEGPSRLTVPVPRPRRGRPRRVASS